MRKIPLAILMSSLFFTIGNAHAIGAVSRACNFADIPTNLQTPAVIFFQAVGAPLWVLNLPGFAASDQRFYWILESLTTDYVETRYYLYAANNIYGQSADRNSPYYNQYTFTWRYASPGWGAEKISMALQSDSRLAIFYFNRGPLYSVRAGESSIVIDDHSALDHSQHANFAFSVYGSHYYYDPVSKITVTLQGTKAVDCNLGQFGLQGGGIFDR